MIFGVSALGQERLCEELDKIFQARVGLGVDRGHEVADHRATRFEGFVEDGAALA